MLSSLLNLLAYIGLVWYTGIWTICLFGLYRARCMFLYTSPITRQQSCSEEEEANLPGVSILRPLAGQDSNLYNNLCSTFEQDYPKDRYEVIFSVDSSYDQAVSIAREVQAKYASLGFNVRLIIGDVPAGVNPKINNLLRPYDAARYDILWVLDSQVRLVPSSLRTSVHHLTSRPPNPSGPSFLPKRKPHGSRVGLVHHVPLGEIPESSASLGSQVERAFLSTTHAKMYIAINSMAIDSCVMGKSNLWRKSDLEQVDDSFFGVGEDGSRTEDGEGALGSEAFKLNRRADEEGANGSSLEQDHNQAGDTSPLKDHRPLLARTRPLARFSIYLAEDNMLALSLWSSSPPLSHVLGSSSACIARTNVSDIKTLRDYISRRMRWIRVRRYMVAEATYAEPFTESIVVGLGGVLTFTRLGWLDWASRVIGGGSTTTSIVFLLLHFSLWHLVDLSVLQALTTDAHSSSKPPLFLSSFSTWLSFFKAWSVREVLALPIWCWAMWGGNEVEWRGQPYRILPGARAARLVPGSGSGRASRRR